MSAQRRHGDKDSDVFGTIGENILTGTDDRDRIYGNDGNDTLNGQGDRDRLSGGNGNDILNGGTDRDRLTGGDGADTFVFAIGDGEDRIRDFEIGIDKIDLSAFGITNADALIASAESHDDYIEIDLGNGDSIRIDHVTASDLTPGDFIL